MQPGFLAGLVEMSELELADEIIPFFPNAVSGFTF